jgi:hypothetical protein
VLGDHQGEERRHGQERGRQVVLEHPAPVCGGLLKRGHGHAVAAREGGEDVETAEPVGHEVPEGFEVGFPGAVGRLSERRAPSPGDGLDGG